MPRCGIPPASSGRSESGMADTTSPTLAPLERGADSVARCPLPDLELGTWNLELQITSMRITGGKAARRILKVPKGLDVRPTPDLVKQAVFNSLGARVAGARVLELFAGTGALSLECLSRGAVSAQ